MAIDTSGKWWVGSEPADVLAYVEAYSGQSYPADVSAASACTCGSKAFHLFVDRVEGAAKRVCVRCSEAVFIGDSAESSAKLKRWKCSCKTDECNIGVGFSLRDEPRSPFPIFRKPRDVRWIFVACRCVQCGTLGCVAEWKITHSPSHALIKNV